MKCPLDQTELVMAERHGVEIDYCPKCRGVWLDRGELDKIIERAVPAVAQPEPAPPVREYREPETGQRPHVDREPYRGEPRREWREPYREDRDREKYHKKKRRKSFLEEIFDFD